MKHFSNKSVLALSLCALTAATLASCHKTVEDSEQVLEVFCAKLGYGSDWCDQLLKAFEQEDWVKEKYPNLQVIFETSADRSSIGTRIQAGEGRNTVDLVFSDGLSGMIGVDNNGNECSENLTDTVYNTQVPGESIKVIDKMNPYYRNAVKYYQYGESSFDQSLPFKAYDFYWATGMMGIVYNVNLLQKFGYDHEPRTSEEFAEACAKITADSSADYGKKYAIMWAGSADYAQYFYNIWWGQYEGYDNYLNYWNGVSYDGDDYTEKSSDIFKQVGRLEAVDAMINVFSNTNGYRYASGAATDFKAAQRYFTRGEGVFMFNGDWLYNESKEQFDSSPYTFRMMKSPIISSIINKTPTIKSETELRDVIAKIDEGKKTAAEAGLDAVSEEDYQRILQARSVTYALGPGCSTFIPNYAKGKGIACDFLRFMATDKAQVIYGQTTGGASLPFTYDIKKNNPDVYQTFSDLEKSRYEMFNESVHGSTVLPYGDNYPLSKFGGLKEWTTFALNGTIMQYVAAGTATGSTSAQAAFDRDIEYWTNNNSQKWFDCLRLAGYNS